LVDQYKAGDLVKIAAEKVGGKGGGRPDMAQAGGTDPSGVAEALALVETYIQQQSS
jgi:alanyl-tRNA synthetase